MEVVRIAHGQCEQIEEQFPPPFDSLPQHGIVLQDLVRCVNPPHVFDVVDNAERLPNVVTVVIHFVQLHCLRQVYCREHVDISLVMVLHSKKVVPLPEDALPLRQLNPVSSLFLLFEGFRHAKSDWSYCTTGLGVEQVQLGEQFRTCVEIIHENVMSLV